jgi:hypothetical protein
MKKAICTTTINPASEALIEFSKFSEWDLIVALDANSKPFELQNSTVLTIQDQEEISKELSEAIGFSSIQRRNFAILWALRNGYDSIALVDDDNIPKSNWENIASKNNFTALEFKVNAEIFDPLSVIEECKIEKVSHRGVPINYYGMQNLEIESLERVVLKPDVIAMLWDGDWDVNAIDRIHKNCYGTLNVEQSYFSTTISPFNSQNTVLTSEAAKEYFLLPFIGRFDDILASYALLAGGYQCVYTEPTVRQVRNAHSLQQDINNELWGYHYIESIVSDLVSGKDLCDLEVLPKKSKIALDIWRELTWRI